MFRQIVLTSLFLFCCCLSRSIAAAGPSQPNVLMIVVDDLNDWISLLDPQSPIETPNLARLAKRGMLFTRAYCASPACNPSRVATLTGLRPSTSGVYGNKSDWRRALPNRKTIMQHFQAAGYHVRGAGKIFHHQLNGAFHDQASFDEFQPMATERYPDKKLNRAPKYGSRNTDWGVFPLREEDSIDHKTVSFVVDALKSNDQPQFLACGIYKPHSPFFAPARYHTDFRQTQLSPIRNAKDWDDLPSGATQLMRGKKWFWTGMMELERKHEGSYQDFLRAYAACATFADQQIGRVLDALEQSPRHDNTIVVLWSDHGFHLGEKDHIEKFALWEKSTHIPFLIAAPGITKPGSRCDRPVDMMSLYPTLLELCNLPKDEQCEDRSVVPLLKDAKAQWDTPAVMSYLQGNHAVRSDRWRYIRYADGSEELYDHESDPHEHRNLANQSNASATDAKIHDYAKVIDSHRKWLPQHEVTAVGDLKPKK